MRSDLNEVIEQAIEVKKLNDLDFVTVWRINDKCYGFNFDKKHFGHIEYSYGDKREVVGVY